MNFVHINIPVFRKYFRNLGLTQSQFIKETHTYNSLISRLLRGNTKKIRPEFAQSIANRFNIPLEELILNVAEPTTNKMHEPESGEWFVADNGGVRISEIVSYEKPYLDRNVQVMHITTRLGKTFELETRELTGFWSFQNQINRMIRKIAP